MHKGIFGSDPHAGFVHFRTVAFGNEHWMVRVPLDSRVFPRLFNNLHAHVGTVIKMHLILTMSCDKSAARAMGDYELFADGRSLCRAHVMQVTCVYCRGCAFTWLGHWREQHEIFSFVNAVLFRPPAVEKPGQLVEVWHQVRSQKRASTAIHHAEFS